MYIVIGFCLAFYGLYNGVRAPDDAEQLNATDVPDSDFGATTYGDDAGSLVGLLAAGAHRMLHIVGSDPPLRQQRQQNGQWVAEEDLEKMRTILQPTSAFMKPIWAVYGAFDLDELSEAPTGVSMLMWLYVLISSVILVNLLVAMFSDTYTKVIEKAEEEFRYQRYQRMFIAQNVWNPIPPPFSLPVNCLQLFRIALRALLAPCLAALQRGRGGNGAGAQQRSRALSAGGLDEDEEARKPPSEAKRLQQLYLHNRKVEEKGTIGAKTTLVQEAMAEMQTRGDQQYMLMMEALRHISEVNKDMSAQLREQGAQLREQSQKIAQLQAFGPRGEGAGVAPASLPALSLVGGSAAPASVPPLTAKPKSSVGSMVARAMSPRRQ